MRQETEKIRELLHHTFEGEPWHGHSLSTTLHSLSAEQTLLRFHAETHNISELVVHLTHWRIFAIEKLKGNEAFDIALNTPADWPVIHTLTEEEWKKIQDALLQTQHQLMESLDVLPDSRLDETVSGRAYSFRVLLYGIIQHDTYHGGQIALLQKAGRKDE